MMLNSGGGKIAETCFYYNIFKMENLDTNQIQCVYDELLAMKDNLRYYSEKTWITENEFWEMYNSKVKKLEELTGSNLAEYSLKVQYKADHSCEGFADLTYSGNYVETSVFSLQISGLLAWLENNHISKRHIKKVKESLSSNASPFVINQHLSQSQNVNIQISIEEFKNVIDDNRKKYAKGSKETTFLDKVKAGLGTVKNIKDIILLIHGVAKSVGLTLDDIKRIIS